MFVYFFKQNNVRYNYLFWNSYFNYNYVDKFQKLIKFYDNKVYFN